MPVMPAIRVMAVIAGGLILSVTLLGILWVGVAPGWADEPEPVDDARVVLPTDRLAERRLDFARRLIDDGRWSDAATLLDQILESDRDSFFKPDARASTWQSVKMEAGRMVGALPKEGRDAYTLQFRARAERMLAEAIASGNSSGIVGVARRWFHTPAGQRATLLAAIEAIDAEQPLAAAAWLDRLAAADASWLEPTLSIMRAIAWYRAGDEAAAEAILDKARVGPVTAARIGGRDISLSYPPGAGREWLATLAGPPRAAAATADEWRLHRGDPARNAIVATSRPLLVARYRVPLTRHPEEARWLEMRRKQASDQELPLLPAAMPLAVGGTLLVHTPMGLLAVDFATGKRLWLQGGSAAAPVADTTSEDDGEAVEAGTGRRQRLLAPVFDDATSGTLASDGTHVFAVESHPDALVGRDGSLPQLQMFGGGDGGGGWAGGNSLVAYRIADKGRPLWRIPAPTAAGADQAAPAWVMGPPLPVGDRLFVLVEEAGEVRLDVLEAATGRTVWTQPLAELDDELKADNRDNHVRRVLGLSPALAEGVLVCPTGAGAVIAVDLATRTLLWAYNYPLAGQGDMIVMQNGVRVPRPGRILGGRVVINGRVINGQPVEGLAGRWVDSAVILSGGRVILAPPGSEEIHCLDLRTGKAAWTRPRNNGLYVAGVVGEKVVVIGHKGVDALSLDTGASVWSTPLATNGEAVSGRALLDAHRLFVPLDTPEVVEIDVATGKAIGRSAGRGGAVPGNLIAYRGEVVSQGVDSLDVFHQTAPLESRIETALEDGTAEQGDAWALLWGGHLKLDRGSTAAGLRDLQAAMAAEPGRFPPDMLAAAFLFAMQRDFAAAGPLWRDVVELAASPELTRRALRVAIDGLIAGGDFAQAWDACRRLLELPAADVGNESEGALVADVADPLLVMAEPRWIQGRLADLRTRAPDMVRTAIDEFARTAIDRMLTADDATEGDTLANGLTAFIERFGHHPQALRARRVLVDELARLAALATADSDVARTLHLRRELLLIDLLHAGVAADREHAASQLAEVRGRLGLASADDADTAWPVGRVAVSRSSRGRSADEQRARILRIQPIPVEAGVDGLLRGMRLGFDMQQGGLTVSDGFGRSVGDPLTIEESRPFGGMANFNAGAADAAVVGRLAVIRTGGFIVTYDLATGVGTEKGSGRHRRLWTHAGQPGNFFQQPGFSVVINRRFPRSGSVPLGMRTPEPTAGDGDGDMMPGAGSITNQGGPVRVTGVPVFMGRSVQLRDPVTGVIRWERHRLPAGGLTFGDDDYLCVCPPNGRKAVVLSMVDGRMVRTCDLPGRERRLLTHGRHVVAIEFAAGQSGGAGRDKAEAVTLHSIDPVDMGRTLLGSYSGEARAASAGDGALAVLEPAGRLTIIDLVAMRTVFTTQLPDMPTGFNRVAVVPWRDRYFVIAGRKETQDEDSQLDKAAVIEALPQSMQGGQPLTGSIWAIDRTSGDMLWPVPATVLRHCLQPHQPCELPVLLFARQIDIRPGDGQPRLSVLCLDKRTGHAAHVDDRISSQQHMLLGCDLRGDPAAHTIAIVPGGGVAAEVKLEFTGTPMAPQPPFQAGGRPIFAGDVGTELEYWWKRLITLPLPF